jgi:hypothetical protein
LSGCKNTLSQRRLKRRHEFGGSFKTAFVPWSPLRDRSEIVEGSFRARFGLSDRRMAFDNQGYLGLSKSCEVTDGQAFLLWRQPNLSLKLTRLSPRLYLGGWAESEAVCGGAGQSRRAA